MKQKGPLSNVVIVADEWSTLDHARDSTLHLLNYGHQRKLFKRAFWTEAQDLVFVASSRPKVHSAKIQEVRFHERGSEVYLRPLPGRSSTFDLLTAGSIHWRVDPPINLQIFSIWQSLAAFASLKGRAQFINAPSGLLLWNEKYSTARYPSWALPSVFMRDKKNLKAALNSFGFPLPLDAKTPVLQKDPFEAASRGVKLLQTSAQQSLTGTLQVIQNFSKKINSCGETRAFILKGKATAWLKKSGKAPASDPIYRFEGGFAPTVEETKPTARQMQRAQVIAKDLKRDGIHFATIDFIDEKILEINVTSPGLLWGLTEASKRKVCRAYWDF